MTGMRLRPLAHRVVVDVGIKELPDGPQCLFSACAHPRLPASHDLHVLLRHRQRSIPRSGVGVSVLLRQPHGFKGFGQVLVGGGENDLPKLELEGGDVPPVKWCPASSASPVGMNWSEDPIASLNKPLRFKPKVAEGF